MAQFSPIWPVLVSRCRHHILVKFLFGSFYCSPSLTYPPPYKKSNLRETFQWLKVKSCKSCHISLHRFLNLAFIVERFHSLNNYLRSRLQSVQTTRHPKVCVDSIPFCFLSTVDGDWSNWNKWTACSKTCGEGTQIRIRTCDDPKPLHGGKQCEGAAQEARVCNTRKCPGMFLKNVLMVLVSTLDWQQQQLLLTPCT